MFKKYDQKQQFLLPLSLEDFIAEDHIGRILNDIIDAIDITTIESKYSEEGCPAYHPRLLIKILLYGYMINIRSSREIFKMTHTDTAFMYLAAMQHPDFRTICRFRSSHLDSIKDVFSQVVTVCKEMDMLGIGKISLDGTKIKAAKKKLEQEKLEKINVTDNDAKIMKHKDGSLKPSYNGQIAVDDKEHVIVAADFQRETSKRF
jgi:transposase